MLQQHATLFLRLGRRLVALAGMSVVAACSVPGPTTQNAESLDIRMRHEVKLASGDALSFLAQDKEDGQPVILVHGTPGEAMGWIDYLADDMPGLRLIAIDRPGFGKSGPDNAVTSLAAQADAIAQLADALRLKPAILVGHSLGGPVVARFAVDYPDRTLALVILAGSLDPAQEDVPFIQHVGDAWPFSAILPRAIRNANREIIALEAELRDLEPRLPGIRVPVQILHGTADDLVPYANAGFMQKHMTGATRLHLLTLHGQNHFLPWNEKRRVRDAIRAAAAGTAATTAGAAHGR